MPDREKVIKGLTACRKTACESCPYNASSGEISNPICFINEMLSDALALLKEHDAVVRCKDCKYYDRFNGCMSWHDVNSNNDNWYCADGECKEGR